jgi:DNA-directed RNA polymerase subunit K/omega
VLFCIASKSGHANQGAQFAYGKETLLVTIYESLHNIPIDRLAEAAGGKARLTYLISQRLRAVNNGAQLLVERQPGEALLAAVCREVMEKKIWLEIPEPEETPAEEEEFDLLALSSEESGGLEL